MLLNRNLRNQRSRICETLGRSYTYRQLSSSTALRQQHRSTQPSLHSTYYRTHGRALFKCLTLAFFSYQVFYWIWLTLETETMKDKKSRTIQTLQNEVKMLSSGKGTHVLEAEKRLLDEKNGR